MDRGNQMKIAPAPPDERSETAQIHRGDDHITCDSPPWLAAASSQLYYVVR